MKRKLICLITGVVLAGMLAGCGGAADDPAEETVEETADGAADAGNDFAGGYLKDIKAEEYVTLGNYKGVEVAVTKGEVTDEDIEATMETVLTQNPMPVEVDEAAANGHLVNIDFVGKRDGVEFEGGSGTDYPLELGSGSFIADLEAGIVGMKKGEVKDVPVVFPDPYTDPELAGQEAVFTVTMNSVSSYPEDQELTDEFVVWLTAGEQTTVAELRAEVADSLTQQMDQIYTSEKASRVTEAVLANCEFKELPEALVNRIETALRNNITSYASMYGMDMAGFMVAQNMMSADQDPEEVIREQVDNTVRNYLAFQAIANLENLNVTEEEIAESLTTEAEASGTTLEQYEAGIDREGYKEYMMLDRVTNYLVENAVEVAE